ncbi:hypothetical protein predicted by Glimmer/Critica [Acetobacter senegalensis]|uniref:Uncharacterized protein n=1 Tax=Acetobacter senegalensis TaxID=446692 RepID=A0A0U5EW71_9PROT|nr:hypothetical protein predicted by Glimmer/Critica [Acetobacter senegalensis]
MKRPLHTGSDDLHSAGRLASAHFGSLFEDGGLKCVEKGRSFKKASSAVTQKCHDILL